MESSSAADRLSKIRTDKRPLHFLQWKSLVSFIRDILVNCWGKSLIAVGKRKDETHGDTGVFRSSAGKGSRETR